MSDNPVATDTLAEEVPKNAATSDSAVENQQPVERELSKAGDDDKKDAGKEQDLSASFIENQVNNVFGRSSNLPPGLRMGERGSTFFETKLDIKREMEERNRREFDVWGKETYLNATKQSNLIPMAIALRQLPTEELNLSHRVIDAQDLRPLCLSLHTNANISTLKLDDNSIGIDGAKWLLTALKENVAVRELSLADNHLGNAVCALVAELLAINRNLVSVNLSGNSLDDRAGRDIGAILEVTFTLKALNLGRNKLSDGAADEIAHALHYNDSIESFNLEWNNFMPPGCRYIFNGIKKNIGVRHFAFTSNGTDDTCVQSIIDMLNANHFLQSLDISSSRISDKVIPAIISQGLAKNDTLEQINLSGNLVSESSLIHFFDFIRTSPSCPPLKKVILTTVPVKAKTVEQMVALRKERPEAAVIVSGPTVVGVVGRKPGPPTPRMPENNNNSNNNNNNNNTANEAEQQPVETQITATVASELGGNNQNGGTPTPCSRQSSQLEF